MFLLFSYYTYSRKCDKRVRRKIMRQTEQDFCFRTSVPLLAFCDIRITDIRVTDLIFSPLLCLRSDLNLYPAYMGRRTFKCPLIFLSPKWGKLMGGRYCDTHYCWGRRDFPPLSVFPYVGGRPSIFTTFLFFLWQIEDGGREE